MSEVIQVKIVTKEMVEFEVYEDYIIHFSVKFCRCWQFWLLSVKRF